MKRNGAEVTEHVNFIKVGDVIKIQAGMSVPVDGIVILGSGVASLEAAVTGESDEMKKDSLEGCKARQEEKD